MSPLLNAVNITMQFNGLTALESVNLSIPPQSVVALIGPNGAGKTTLFNCISGIYKPTKGNLYLNGRELKLTRKYTAARNGIGRTFQNVALFNSLSVADNIYVGLNATLPIQSILRLGLSKTRPNPRSSLPPVTMESILDLLDLRNISNILVSELPFAIQKRVELGRALIASPSLLLLDEPACGLNNPEQEELVSIIAYIREQYKLSILIVEHNMAIIHSVADIISVLNFGKKIAEGTPDEILHNKLVIDAYLGVDI